jgi:hypothetical protein
MTKGRPDIASALSVTFEKEITIERRVSKGIFRQVKQEAKLTVAILGASKTRWTFSGEGMAAPIVVLDPLTEGSTKISIPGNAIHVEAADGDEEFLLSDEAWESLRETVQEQQKRGGTSVPPVYIEKEVVVERRVQGFVRCRMHQARLTLTILGAMKTHWRFSSEKMDPPIAFWDHDYMYERMRFGKRTLVIRRGYRDPTFIIPPDALESLREIVRKHEETIECRLRGKECPNCLQKTMLSDACINCGHIRWRGMALKFVADVSFLSVCVLLIIVGIFWGAPGKDLEDHIIYFCAFVSGGLKSLHSLCYTVFRPIGRALRARAAS